MTMYDDEFLRYDPYEDLHDERAYDAAVLRHAKAQALEDRDTGYQLDPLPAFEDWCATNHDTPDDA